MRRFSIANIREAFNGRAEGFSDMASDRRFIGACFGIALLAMPFSTTVGLLALATPTVYYGIGMAYKLGSYSLNVIAPKPSSPGD